VAVVYMENCRMVGVAMKYYRITITDIFDCRYSDFVTVENNDSLEKAKNEFLELVNTKLDLPDKEIAVVATVEISKDDYEKAMLRRETVENS
jgi:hypothetical protein